MSGQTSITMPAQRNRVVVLALLLCTALSAQQSLSQEAPKPNVGKNRPCPAPPDCSSLPCQPNRDTRSCTREGPFGIRLTDPACEAMKAAQNSAFENCSANANALRAECEASKKQAVLCNAVKSQEIDRCKTDPLEFDRLVTAIRAGWWHSRIPRQIQASLKGEFDPDLMKDMLITDRLRALTPNQFALDALKREGWLTVNNVVIFASHIPEHEICPWVQVLVSAAIAADLGADGYCQVLEFQPDFMKEAIDKRAARILSKLNCRY
jgi:hypothetical protein